MNEIDAQTRQIDYQALFADRIGGASFGRTDTVYKFERIKRAKAAAKLAHPELPLIDLGVGEGDWAADPLVVERLCAEAGNLENRRYADNGIIEFQQAAAVYLERVYGVQDLDPQTEVLHGIGSKPLLALLPAAFINPSDVLLTTTPCYPVAATWTKYLGGEVFSLPLLSENAFLPDLESIPASILARAKMLYLNYPNNPTGAVADHAFFEKVVEFARRNSIIVIHDAAYAALTYEGYKPLSFLSVPGARDVGVEIHSLSKAFNMTGWRIGFVCGNSNIVAACAAVKDNTDAGQFRAVQKAAITALEHPEITIRTVEKYSRRFDALVPLLRGFGFEARKPSGSFYCYVKAPVGTADGIRFANAADFSDYLLRELHISTVPWDEAGTFIRFSVTFEAETPGAETRVINELRDRLGKIKLVF